MFYAARLMAGATLVVVPTIVYGGLVVLGVIITRGAAGMNPGITLTPLQVLLYRAGHAHAGVLVILSLVVHVLLDQARLGPGLTWMVRVAAAFAAILVSGGFFGFAHVPQLRAILYAGAALVALVTLTTGIGLLVSLQHGAGT